ncbi:MAG: hypothetical protein IKR76_08160 [Ruminococcus sp.]|nr:hypothetical protein [Ruminococcus sp.]
MKSDVIRIYSDLKGRKEALEAAESFVRYNEFTGKSVMSIRLLTEELISMVHGIMDKFSGDLWFESEPTEGGVRCLICLSAKRTVDPVQEEKILSVSTSGKNEYAKGILGKIREAFRVSAQHANDGVYMDEYISVNNWYRMGTDEQDTNVSERYWSLMNYRNCLSAGDHASEEWDELEKSIIAKLADDVKVWLKSDSTEVVIEKFIAK